MHTSTTKQITASNREHYEAEGRFNFLTEQLAELQADPRHESFSEREEAEAKSMTGSAASGLNASSKP